MNISIPNPLIYKGLKRWWTFSYNIHRSFTPKISELSTKTTRNGLYERVSKHFKTGRYLIIYTYRFIGFFMKYITKSEVVKVRDNYYWLLPHKKGYYSIILKRMYEQLFCMLDHHSKVLVIRFDLHQPTFTNDNKRITTFNRRMKKWLSRHYSISRIGYVWVRERERVKQQHYHFALFLNGNKLQHPSLAIDYITETWQAMSGFCYTPKNSFYQIRRDDTETLESAIKRLSYLAKAKGKGSKPKGTNDYYTSNVKPKEEALCL